MSVERSPVRPSESVMSARVGNETVLLNMTSGLYFGLDEVASQIWSRLHSGKNADEICAELLEQYSVPSHVLEHDVHAFVGDLRAANLVV